LLLQISLLVVEIIQILVPESNEFQWRRGVKAADEIRRWSTAEVAQTRRLDYFASAISDAVYPLGVHRADQRTFQADVSFAHLGSIGVCKTTGSPHQSYRGRNELARTNDHCFIILMLLQAAWTADHRGSLQLSPRDVLIIDSEYPLKTEISNPFTSVAVAVSESWLRQWLPNPNLITARRIAGGSLWGHALSSYVSELTPELASSPPLPLPVIADQVGSLLSLTATGIRGANAANTPAERSLYERIHDCIMQRCTEWELTAADVAASMNISLRTLHRIFAAANQTFGAALIEARARVSLRMLNSPSFNRLTTAEVGRRAGFPSASHFARVIRSRTGLTPLELRHGINGEVRERKTVDGRAGSSASNAVLTP
jgi:AraC-like DNA-binding protein